MPRWLPFKKKKQPQQADHGVVITSIQSDNVRLVDPTTMVASTPTTTTTPTPPSALRNKPVVTPKQIVDTDIKSAKPSWLCRTRFFKDMIASAFELVDQDGSGSVDEKELYSGLLLIHLKLGTYAGPAACKPISREKCHAVFMKMDVDQSGYLDRQEFEAVIQVLFGNVMMRVAIQYACTLMIVPLLAQQTLNLLVAAMHFLYQVWIKVLEHEGDHQVAIQTMEVALEQLWSQAVEFWTPYVPLQVYEGIDVLHGYIQAIPDSVWNSIPLTLLSTILSLMLIPWSLLQIDDFFQRLAERSGGAPKEKTH